VNSGGRPANHRMGIPIRTVWVAAGIAAPWLLSACGTGTRPPPEAGFERGGVPVLSGMRVMVLPVQRRPAGHTELDSEVEYALQGIGPGVDWVFPGDLRVALSRNPGVGVQVDGLPVQGFLAGELERVGDPLFGDLYRLGTLANARYGLLPVEARTRAGDLGVVLEIHAALLDLRNGYVMWFGVVEGGEGMEGDPYVLASSAEALARRVVR